MQQLNANTETPRQVADLLLILDHTELATEIAIPIAFNGTLKEFQVQGFNWMVRMEREDKQRGGPLADEMGFGKTVQANATIIPNGSTSWDRAAFLIVVTKPVFAQWLSEIVSKVKPAGRVGPLNQRFRFVIDLELTTEIFNMGAK